MTFVHLADLHIGKKLGAFDLIEDQKFALNAILDQVARLHPDAAFLAGDIFDRALPSTDAVSLADEFLTKLAAHTRVLIVGGNHDSVPRLSFASALMRKNGVYIAREYAGELEKVTLTDAFGAVDVYLLPYVRPREVEHFFVEEAPDGFVSADDAVRAILARAGALDSCLPNRSVLITHQFAIHPSERCQISDSEINPIGGLSEVDARAFDAFNYVALGHLHAPQKLGDGRARYAGSPLKYSFSEARHKKSFVFGEMDARGNVSVTLVPIPFLRDVRALEGPAERLVENGAACEGGAEDYVSIRLTGVLPASPMEYLGAVYRNIVRLEIGTSPDAGVSIEATSETERPPIERFIDFFRLATGDEPTEAMLAAATEAMDQAIREVSL